MTFSWRSYIDVLSANVQRVRSRHRLITARSWRPLCRSGGCIGPYLPAAHAKQEAHNIALLLLLQLLEVLVGAHLCEEMLACRSLQPPYTL